MLYNIYIMLFYAMLLLLLLLLICRYQDGGEDRRNFDEENRHRRNYEEENRHKGNSRGSSDSYRKERRQDGHRKR